MADPRNLADIRYINACAALQALQAHVDELYTHHQGDPFNWGVVGDLGRYEAQLMALVQED